MDRHVEIKFHLEGQGITPESLGWTGIREFLDKLVAALATMDGGPGARDVVPVAIRAGSAEPILRMERRFMRAVYRFREGPTDRWTPEAHRKAAVVYDFLAERNARLSCGARTMKPVRVPHVRPTWEVSEQTTLMGEVRRAGGDRGKVEMDLENYGHFHCAAGREIAKELAQHLYERVAVTGEMTRDIRTNTVTAFQIRGFKPSTRTDLAAALRQLHELLGNSMDGADPKAFLKEVRG